MAEIRFYHLHKKKASEALPEIIGKALERNFKILIKTTDEEKTKEIDEYLWTYDAESFIPHGSKTGKRSSEHPVWITSKEDNPNGANMLIIFNGAETGDISSMDLCCELFDGNDEKTLETTRSRWKEYKEKGFELSYFQQDENGRWDKKQ